jgi:transketolase
VIRAVDGHDVAAVSAAIAAAKQADKPTLICCKTVIGKGSPNLQGGDKVHGAALGEKVAAVREYIGWSAAPFEIPADVYAPGMPKPPAPSRKPTGTPSSPNTAPFPAEAAELSRRMAGELPGAFDAALAAGIASTVEKKKTSPPARPARTPSRRWRRCCRNSWAARPT